MEEVAPIIEILPVKEVRGTPIREGE